MHYGITGNTTKPEIWQPIAELVRWLEEQGIGYSLHQSIADGLVQRGDLAGTNLTPHSTENLARISDLILSFGGDGTLLRAAHDLGTDGLPILGVNIGRLGFLANVEVDGVRNAIAHLERGDYEQEKRLVLAAQVGDGPDAEHLWALNDIALERGGPVGMIGIDVTVDGMWLNRYWADGLIVATPTGSTAYSLAVGGPIVAPASEVIILSPIAPHSLTVRPFVLPAQSTINIQVASSRQPYVVAADGISTQPMYDPVPITISRATHHITLVTLPGQHYFKTLRHKLTWGGGTQQ